jgi:hypothetical protein
VEAFAKVFERRAAPINALQSYMWPAGARLRTATIDLLVETACKTASQFLSLCIRAIDYCPPVDIRFGEYLRALITADHDLVEDDKYKFRQELIAAFAKCGIFPDDVPDISVESLLWNAPRTKLPSIPSLSLSVLGLQPDPGQAPGPEEIKREAGALADVVTDPRYMGEFGVSNARGLELPRIESVRILRRVGPDRQVRFGLVCEVLQSGTINMGSGKVRVVGGSTVILDGAGEIRFVIRKRVDNHDRLSAAGRFRQEQTAYTAEAAPEGSSVWARVHAGYRRTS